MRHISWCDHIDWYIGRSAFHEISRRFCFLNKKNPVLEQNTYPVQTLNQYCFVTLFYDIHTVNFLIIDTSSNTYAFCDTLFMTYINCYMFRKSQHASLVSTAPYRTHYEHPTHTHTHTGLYIYKYMYIFIYINKHLRSINCGGLFLHVLIFNIIIL